MLYHSFLILEPFDSSFLQKHLGFLQDNRLITDAPLKALTVFAMPMILGNFFQQVYNMADSIIVGQFVGSSALAAVGACAALTNVFICIALGTGVRSVFCSPCFCSH